MGVKIEFSEESGKKISCKYIECGKCDVLDIPVTAKVLKFRFINHVFCETLAETSILGAKLIFSELNATKIRSEYLEFGRCRIYAIPENARVVDVCFATPGNLCSQCYLSVEELPVDELAVDQCALFWKMVL